MDLDAHRWQAVITRTPGDFVFAVRTTGVFCRPGCRSRLPRRENVRFFDSPAQARRAGFRPCKRCRPENAPGAAVTQAARKAAAASVAELARQAGLSPAAFRRAFTQATGVTPRAYAAQLRTNAAQRALTKETTVTTAMLEAGYQSASRFYEATENTLGMAPAQYRAGGAGLAMQAACAPCDLGWVLVAVTARGICAILLGDSRADLMRELRARFHAARIVESQELGSHLRAVAALIKTPALGLSLPLDVQGTAFQRRVWQELMKIRPGQTSNYQQVAKAIGNPKAARAVASAIAANPLAVAIPCHRVVGTDGKLHGYRWGLKRKQSLLDRET